jgi:hypothetical protein
MVVNGTTISTSNLTIAHDPSQSTGTPVGDEHAPDLQRQQGVRYSAPA